MKKEKVIDISPAALLEREMQKWLTDPENEEFLVMAQCNCDFDSAVEALEAGRYNEVVILCNKIMASSQNIGQRIATMAVLGLAKIGDAKAIEELLSKIYDLPEITFE